MPEVQGPEKHGDGHDEFESFMRKTLRTLGFVFALPLIPVAVAAVSSSFACWVSIATLLAAAFAFFRPQPLPLMRTRLGAIGLAYLSLVGVIAGYSGESDKALQAKQDAAPVEQAGQSAPAGGEDQ